MRQNRDKATIQRFLYARIRRQHYLDTHILVILLQKASIAIQTLHLVQFSKRTHSRGGFYDLR